MKARQEAETRDRRRKDWFSIDDEVIVNHGPNIGAYGIAVYAALCKHASGSERVRIGLSQLAKLLKMGRATLLKTLDVLKKEGLISIEAGDRAHVSVYTILQVTKNRAGGSIQNQEDEEGGSIQNQGGSIQNQTPPKGGSDQNCNQIEDEPNSFTKEERAREPLPDDVTSQCLLLLKKVKGMGKNYGELALLLAELREEYPFVDPEKVCKDYELYHRNPPKPTKNHLLKLRRFFENAEKWRDKNVHISKASFAGNGKPRDPSKPLRMVSDAEAGL